MPKKSFPPPKLAWRIARRGGQKGHKAGNDLEKGTSSKNQGEAEKGHFEKPASAKKGRVLKNFDREATFSAAGESSRIRRAPREKGTKKKGVIHNTQRGSDVKDQSKSGARK